MTNLTRKQRRVKRHLRIRRKIAGTQSVPRMSVCLTSKHLYVQFIDDDAGHTLQSISTLDKELRKENVKADCVGAEKIGELAAQRALAAGITTVVFDRGGFKYHGRIKKIADAARKSGLKL